jgi:hypothetical protein
MVVPLVVLVVPLVWAGIRVVCLQGRIGVALDGRRLQ